MSNLDNKLIPSQLIWDSNFFNLKIGEIRIFENESYSLIDKSMDCLDFQLIYIYIDEILIKQVKHWNLGNLVDIKVTYEFKFDKEEKYSVSPQIKECKNITPELLQLSLQAGHNSRFKTDPNFKKSDFERLYLEWMEKSINGNMADIVLGYYDNDKIVGFVTFKMSQKDGLIGLIAVDPLFRNQGIGGKLLDAIKYYAQKNDIDKITVVTQQNNLAACNLYMKNGFNLIEKKHVFHKWTNNNNLQK